MADGSVLQRHWCCSNCSIHCMALWESWMEWIWGKTTACNVSQRARILIGHATQLRSSIQTLQRPVRQAMQTFGIWRCLPSATRLSPASYKKRRCNLPLWRRQNRCKSMEYVRIAWSQFVLYTVSCRSYAMSARMPSNSGHRLDVYVFHNANAYFWFNETIIASLFWILKNVF